ncbi:MAG: PhnD/SsuA/transferrin family substrate-binding protein, partial [Bacteroidota bacterium]|nr:PhnD/SsuA/transferrin family substrate-binding protein [Bacteroidota bacterium]
MILKKTYRLFQLFIPVCVILLLALLSISSTSNAHEDNQAVKIDSKIGPQTVKIGVLIIRGAEKCLKRWRPTADYLTENIPEYSFEIIPLKFDEVNATVKKGEVDFILANPFFYVELEYSYGISRMVTLNKLSMGEENTNYSGVIFCRADRKDLRNLEDLKGKTFMAVNEFSFGGWQMAWQALKRHGVDPREDFDSLSYGETHDAVIYAVRDDKVDAGSVRSDVFEQIVEEENIRLEEFYVFPCNYYHKHGSEFHFVHSTDIYPEWPIAKVKHTPEKLAKDVTIALLEMSPDNPATKAANNVGWVIPQQYQSVRECLKYLGVGRYKDYGKVTFQAALKQYWFQIACAFIFMCLIVMFALRTVWLNRRLEKSEQKTHAVFNQTFQFMALLDYDGTLLKTNHTAIEFAGIEEKDVLGKPFWETIWWTHSAELQNKLRDAVKKAAGGQLIHFEASHVAYDGTLRSIDFSLKPVKIESDEVTHLIAEGHDITDRKQAGEALRESEERYKNLSNLTFEGILIHENGMAVDVNESLTNIFGYSK